MYWDGLRLGGERPVIAGDCWISVIVHVKYLVLYGVG